MNLISLFLVIKLCWRVYGWIDSWETISLMRSLRWRCSPSHPISFWTRGFDLLIDLVAFSGEASSNYWCVFLIGVFSCVLFSIGVFKYRFFFFWGTECLNDGGMVAWRVRWSNNSGVFWQLCFRFVEHTAHISEQVPPPPWTLKSDLCFLYPFHRLGGYFVKPHIRT